MNEIDSHVTVFVVVLVGGLGIRIWDLLSLLALRVVGLVLVSFVEARYESRFASNRLGLVKSGHLGHPALWNELEESVGSEDRGSADDGHSELTATDCSGHEEAGTDLEEVEAGNSLDTGDDEEDDPGHVVPDQARESVHLLGANITAVDQVEELKPDEGVEDKSEVLLLEVAGGSVIEGKGRLGVFDIEEASSGPHDDAHDDELEDTETEDLTVHNTSHDVALSGAEGGNISLRAGSSEGHSSKDVHDKVDPDELGGVKAGLSHGDLGHEDNDDDSEVARELELKETLNIHVNVAAPHNSGHARVEVVGLEDHGSSVSGEGGTVLDSEGHVGGLKGLNIVDTLTDNSDSAAGVLVLIVLKAATETDNKTELVLGLSASDNLKASDNAVESLLTIGVESVSLLFLLAILDISKLLHDVTDESAEVLGVHCDIAIVVGKFLLGEDTAVTSDSLGGKEVVTGAEAEVDA